MSWGSRGSSPRDADRAASRKRTHGSCEIRYLREWMRIRVPRRSPIPRLKLSKNGSIEPFFVLAVVSAAPTIPQTNHPKKFRDRDPGASQRVQASSPSDAFVV